MAVVSPTEQGALTLINLLKNYPRVTKSSRCWPGLQIPHIPIQLSICETCKNKSNPWGPQLATHRTENIHHQHPGARQVLCPCPGSETSLIHSGASMDRTCSDKSHWCSIGLGSGKLGVLCHVPWANPEQCSSESRVRCRAGWPLPSANVVASTLSATAFRWVVRVKWLTCQGPKGSQ